MVFDLNEQPDEKLSRINAAGLINMTIEGLFKESYTAMSHGNLVLQNRKLDAIWCILGGDEDENGDKDKAFYKIDLSLHKCGRLNLKKTGFEQRDDDENSKVAQQYLWLRKKSLFLRRLQNEQGKGTAYKSDDQDDMD